jgi:hypothetical protein
MNWGGFCNGETRQNGPLFIMKTKAYRAACLIPIILGAALLMMNIHSFRLESVLVGVFAIVVYTYSMLSR